MCLVLARQAKSDIKSVSEWGGIDSVVFVYEKGIFKIFKNNCKNILFSALFHFQCKKKLLFRRK